jgi:hypothetical protein
MISGDCQPSLESTCQPATCRWRCAIEVIDQLLIEPSIITDRDADDLLDLRSKLLNSDDAEGTLKLFCVVRRRMERRHYLPFFRIRKWLENHLVAAVILSPGANEQQVSLRLDHYCVEALRRAALCAALREGAVLDRPSLRFFYRQKSFDQSETNRLDQRSNVMAPAAHSYPARLL